MQAAGGGNVAFAEFKNSAFPYRGMIPADADTNERAKPFLDVNAGGRLGHTSPRGGLLWEDTTYNDRHVLLAAGAGFRPQPAGRHRRLFPRQPDDPGARRRRPPADGRASSRSRTSTR